MTPSPSRPSAKFFWSVIIGFVAFTAIVPVSSRAVNISNTWILPEEGFPVFYRYFRDRISWYEADAVCQFHHANLVTVDTTAQYDATRAYLKELDIVNNVWIGLIRSQPDGLFTWTERREYRPLTHDGYWDEQISQSSSPLCAAMDPAADFRWHSHHCGGPEVASFICELPVPTWASQQDGCMLTSLPSLTVLYLPEQAAVELTSDCGLGGTKSIVCKGKADRDDMIRQLSCGISPEDFDEKGVSKSPNGATGTTETDSVSISSFDVGGDVTSNSILTESTKPWLSSNTVDTDSYDVPTRHRRETEHTDLPATLAVHTSSTTMGSVDTTRPSFDKTSNVPSDESNRTGEEKTWSSTRPPVKITDGFVISDPVEDEIQRDRLNSFGEIDNADPEIMQKLDSNVKQNIVSSPDRVEIPQMDQVVESVDTTSATPINNVRSSDSSNVSNVPSNLNNMPSTLQSNHETVMVAAMSAVDSSSSPDMTDSFTPNSDQLQRYANSAPEFPSAINQGQLFGSGGENGTHFYIDLNDTMADGSNAGSETSAVSVSTVSSVTNTVVATSQDGRVESERRAKNELNKSPVHSFPAVTTMSDTIRELERSTESSSAGDNVKLVELDTDYTATKKKNATGKFLELDDSFTIGDQENDHKIIEINIIDQKTKGAIPAKLIITTKANKRPTTNTKRHVFTSSVKKDGENLKMQNVESVRPVKITAFNETFTEFSNDTQDIVVIDPKLVDLNTNTTKILVVNNNSEPVPIETVGSPAKVVVVPEKIREQELAAQKSQEDSIKKDFLPAPLRQMPDSTALNDIEDKHNSNEEETRPDDEMKEGSVEFNSEIPPRPNRGRLLTRSPHRSYYPYFFSRVLG